MFWCDSKLTISKKKAIDTEVNKEYLSGQPHSEVAVC